MVRIVQFIQFFLSASLGCENIFKFPFFLLAMFRTRSYNQTTNHNVYMYTHIDDEGGGQYRKNIFPTLLCVCQEWSLYSFRFK